MLNFTVSWYTDNYIYIYVLTKQLTEKSLITSIIMYIAGTDPEINQGSYV